MPRKVSQAKIEKAAGMFNGWYLFAETFTRLRQELDVAEFLRENPDIAGLLTILMIENQWDFQAFSRRMAELIPDIMEQDDEYIISCYIAFEKFPAVIGRQSAPKKTGRKKIKKTEVGKSKTQTTGEDKTDPVKLFQGCKNLKNFLAVCKNDPHKVLKLLKQGEEQCGSVLKFAGTIGISNAYYYTNRKRLRSMVANDGQSQQTDNKPPAGDASKKKEDKQSTGGQVISGAFADLIATAETEAVKKMLGHGRASKFRAFYKAVGNEEVAVRAAMEEAYRKNNRPGQVVEWLLAKFSEGDNKFVLDTITLHKYADVLNVDKTGGTAGQSEDASGGDGIEAELAQKLTDGVLDETQVAGLTKLAEQYEVDSMADLLNKLSNNSIDSMAAAKALAEANVLPAEANHVTYMQFRTKIGL